MPIEFFARIAVMFASHAPFDPEGGPMYIRETLKILDSLDVTDELRRKLYPPPHPGQCDQASRSEAVGERDGMEATAPPRRQLCRRRMDFRTDTSPTAPTPANGAVLRQLQSRQPRVADQAAALARKTFD